MQNALFQAKCQIDNLDNAIEDGARVVAYDPETMTIYMHHEDGAEEIVDMGMVRDLLTAVAGMRLPAEPPE